VVGAGLAGLVAGWRLGKLGAKVVVLDRSGRVGGRARAIHRDGFTLEPACPTLTEADRRLLSWVDEVGMRDEWLPLRPASISVLRGSRAREVALRSWLDVLRIAGVRPRQALRLARLPRLMSRYRDALEPENAAAAARLDDRSLADFARLYFGDTVFDRYMLPRAARGGPVDAEHVSRAQFLLDLRRHGDRRPTLPRGSLAEVLERAAARIPLKLGVDVLRVEADEALRVVTAAGDVECDAVVVATGAREAGTLAAPVLSGAERDHLSRVRYLPALSVAVGLCRPLSPRPGEIWLPRAEGGPLERAVVEPGLPAGRVPGGRGLAWLRARQEYVETSVDVPDEAVHKELLDALERACPGVLRTVDFAQVFRVARATASFDVGHYRAIARFDAVQRDRRAAGRRLYFAGDHRVHPSWEGAVVSAERAAREAGSDLGLPLP
jgi:protoporphyrinogen oxidase